MVCRLADQVVTFLLGGEDACWGSAMHRERLHQLWHHKEDREKLVSLLEALLFTLPSSQPNS